MKTSPWWSPEHGFCSCKTLYSTTPIYNIMYTPVKACTYLCGIHVTTYIMWYSCRHKFRTSSCLSLPVVVNLCKKKKILCWHVYVYCTCNSVPTHHIFMISFWVSPCKQWWVACKFCPWLYQHCNCIRVKRIISCIKFCPMAERSLCPFKYLCR